MAHSYSAYEELHWLCIRLHGKLLTQTRRVIERCGYCKVQPWQLNAAELLQNTQCALPAVHPFALSTIKHFDRQKFQAWQGFQ